MHSEEKRREEKRREENTREENTREEKRTQERSENISWNLTTHNSMTDKQGTFQTVSGAYHVSGVY